MVTWDDHEVKDNYAGKSCKDVEPRAFAARRAAAYQAYYEHMPLRRSSMPSRSGMRLYRRVDYGRLASFNVLDTRQYRDHQAIVGSREAEAGARTLMGAEQERWLLDGLRRSPARWNVLAQQIFFARRAGERGRGEQVMGDAWDGYPVARDRISAGLAAAPNPIVLSGDVHSNSANNLLADYRDPGSEVVGAEFVGTSISSGGDGHDGGGDHGDMLAENPHIKFFNGRRGYLRCRVTTDEWHTDYRVVPYVSRPGAGVSTRATFTVRDGVAGLQKQTAGAS